MQGFILAFVLLWCLIAGYAAPTSESPGSSALAKARSLEKRTQLVYINFSNSKQDQAFKAQLQAAWKDSIELMSYQMKAGFQNSIFSHYFLTSDAADVHKVFSNMWGGDDEQGSVNLGSITVDNNDFEDKCATTLNELCYTRNVLRNGQLVGAKIHCCMKERASKLPSIDGITCEALEDMVTNRMLFLGAALLHEYTHFDIIGGESFNPPAHIDDNSGTYGPFMTRTLPDKARAKTTADSYNWLALENFWTTICKKDFTGPRKEADIGAPVACGGQTTCVIQ